MGKHGDSQLARSQSEENPIGLAPTAPGESFAVISDSLSYKAIRREVKKLLSQAPRGLQQRDDEVLSSKSKQEG